MLAGFGAVILHQRIPSILATLTLAEPGADTEVRMKRVAAPLLSITNGLSDHLWEAALESSAGPRRAGGHRDRTVSERIPQDRERKGLSPRGEVLLVL